MPAGKSTDPASEPIDREVLSLRRLYTLLDELIALRIEYAEGAEGERALAALGPAKAAEVRTVLDRAISGLKTVLLESRLSLLDPDRDSTPR